MPSSRPSSALASALELYTRSSAEAVLSDPKTVWIDRQIQFADGLASDAYTWNDYSSAPSRPGAVLVTGPLGSGKTRLCVYEAMRALKAMSEPGEPDCLVPLYIPGRSLNLPEGLPPLQALCHALEGSLRAHSVPLLRPEIEMLFAQGKAYLIIDGLHEIDNTHTPRLDAALSQLRSGVNRTTVLMTARSTWRPQLRLALDELALGPLSPSEMRQFIEARLTSGTRARAMFLQKLGSERLHLDELASNPLFLEQACDLVSTAPNPSQLLSSRTSLLSAHVRESISRFSRQALINTETEAAIQSAVAELAWHLIASADDTMVFSEGQLNQALARVTPGRKKLAPHDLLETGLLVLDSSNAHHKVWRFGQRPLGEYLAASYLALLEEPSIENWVDERHRHNVLWMACEMSHRADLLTSIVHAIKLRMFELPKRDPGYDTPVSWPNLAELCVRAFSSSPPAVVHNTVLEDIWSIAAHGLDRQHKKARGKRAPLHQRPLMSITLEATRHASALHAEDVGRLVKVYHHEGVGGLRSAICSESGTLIGTRVLDSACPSLQWIAIWLLVEAFRGAPHLARRQYVPRLKKIATGEDPREGGPHHEAVRSVALRAISSFEGRNAITFHMDLLDTLNSTASRRGFVAEAALVALGQTCESQATQYLAEVCSNLNLDALPLDRRWSMTTLNALESSLEKWHFRQPWHRPYKWKEKSPPAVRWGRLKPVVFQFRRSLKESSGYSMIGSACASALGKLGDARSWGSIENLAFGAAEAESQALMEPRSRLKLLGSCMFALDQLATVLPDRELPRALSTFERIISNPTASEKLVIQGRSVHVNNR